MIRFKFLNTRVFVSFWTIAIETYAISASITGQSIVLICLLCTLVHELGHLFMISLLVGKPQKIVLNPFEIQICSDLSKVSRVQDTLIISFGIVFNLLLSFITYILYILTLYDIFLLTCSVSLAIGVLNALPVESFDGGQLIKLILSGFLSEKLTNIILCVTSLIVMIPIIFIGVFVLFVSKYNFSLLFIAIYILSIYFKRNCGDFLV